MDFPREEQELSAETIRKAHHLHNADKGAIHNVTFTDAPITGVLVDPEEYVSTGKWTGMVGLYGGGGGGVGVGVGGGQSTFGSHINAVGGGGNNGKPYFPPPLFQDSDGTPKLRHSTTYLDIMRIIFRLQKARKIPPCTLETSREYRDTVTIRVSASWNGKPFTLTWDLPPHAKSSKEWQKAILSKF